jgi:hypothetical protein
MIDGTNNLLLDLQTALAGASERLPRLHLRTALASLRAAIETFNAEPNGDNLRILNGAWSSGKRTLDRYGQPRVFA